MPIRNQVQLITYPDSLGGDLKSLHHVLETRFSDLFQGGIHILPPFPSSGDRGFAPLTHMEIDPSFGEWADLRAIGEDHDLVLDLIVNHTSARSSCFQDFLLHGRESQYADLFITLDKIWPDGNPPPGDVDRIFLRRHEPFSTFTIRESGKLERVWTTFGKVTPSEQIDLDVAADETRRLLARFLRKFSENGVKIVRLDAIGYVIKKAGTTCFFVEPEIYNFLDWISDVSDSLGLKLLPEVHAEHSTQLKLAERGYWIYDFILPYRVLEALIFQRGDRLRQYLQHRPPKQFTMLDCHDGVPIKPDLNGKYDAGLARRLVEICLDRGGNLSLIFSPKHRDPDGFDVHQIRGTYYSLLDEDDDAYLAARAIQFFVPGVPQVYYVGLLAGVNDQVGVERTGEGRDVNRHSYSMAEIEQATEREVVQRLVRLIRFRNEHPAFDGRFHLLTSADDELKMRWEDTGGTCTLSVDLNSYESKIEYSDGQGSTQLFVI
jgi:sucrose phosphorylase